MKKYDCIIVGGGPSGMGAAYFLHKQGIKNICILEKQSEGFHKPCAGLVTRKCEKILGGMGLDLRRESDYFEMNNLSIFYKNQKSFDIINDDYSWLSSKHPNREKLDDLLSKKTKELGIPIFYNVNILDVEKNQVATSTENFGFQNIIFADGVNGYSKKYNKNTKKMNFSLEIVIKDAKKREDFVNLYFGISKRGYAWYGSTGECINVGLTDQYNKNINYIELLTDFAKELGYEINKKDIKGAYFPCGVKKNITYENNVYLIGDAAGLTDPLTAEGLYYAFSTAKYAAEAIAKSDINHYIRCVQPIKKNFKYIDNIRGLFYNELVAKILWKYYAKRKGAFISYAWQKIIIEGKYSYKNVFRCYKSYLKRE